MSPETLQPVHLLLFFMPRYSVPEDLEITNKETKNYNSCNGLLLLLILLPLDTRAMDRCSSFRHKPVIELVYGTMTAVGLGTSKNKGASLWKLVSNSEPIFLFFFATA